MQYKNSYDPRRNDSRSRSRNRHKNKRDASRSDSSDDDRRNRKKDEKKHHSTSGRKRIRFARDQNLQDIKLFRKQDEPNAKHLTQSEIFEYKRKLQVNKNWNNAQNLSSQEIKHRESLMQGRSMKEFKERQKNLNDKIFLVRQEQSYYPPRFLKAENINEKGLESTQKQAHNIRLMSTLGCFYTKLSEIPDQPDMKGILNNQVSEIPPKNIMFQHPTQKDKQQIGKFFKNDQKTKKEPLKPIKGILKRSLVEVRRLQQQQMQDSGKIDQNLLNLVKEITTNKSVYTPQMIQNLLRPYKYNGSLQSIVKLIKEKPKPMISNISMSTMNTSMINHPPTDPLKALSILQDLNKKGLPPNPNPLPFNKLIKPEINMPIMMLPMMPEHRMDKFRTVPCKYYHGPQGCQKRTDCTFIHDQAYAGRPIPNTNKFPMQPMYSNPSPPIYMMNSGISPLMYPANLLPPLNNPIGMMVPPPPPPKK